LYFQPLGSDQSFLHSTIGVSYDSVRCYTDGETPYILIRSVEEGILILIKFSSSGITKTQYDISSIVNRSTSYKPYSFITIEGINYLHITNFRGTNIYKISDSELIHVYNDLLINGHDSLATDGTHLISHRTLDVSTFETELVKINLGAE
jgi:hypothetical protein